MTEYIKMGERRLQREARQSYYHVLKKGSFIKSTCKFKQSMSSSSAVYPLTATLNLAGNEMNKRQKTKRATDPLGSPSVIGQNAPQYIYPWRPDIVCSHSQCDCDNNEIRTMIVAIKTYASLQTSNCFFSNWIRPSFTVTSAKAPSCDIDSVRDTAHADIGARLNDIDCFAYGGDDEFFAWLGRIREDG